MSPLLKLVSNYLHDFLSFFFRQNRFLERIKNVVVQQKILPSLQVDGNFLSHFTYLWKIWDPLTWGWPRVPLFHAFSYPLCVSQNKWQNAIGQTKATSHESWALSD